MKLMYVANARMPTEKAHGVAIAKACETFAAAGAEVTLVVPRRKTPLIKSVYETYAVKPVFSVKFLPVIDLIREKAGRFVFLLETFTFYVSLFAFMFSKPRRNAVVYVREVGYILLSVLGFRVVLECHFIPKQRRIFFALARRAGGIIVISQALKRAFVQAGFASDGVLVAPSGVDLSIFDIKISKEEARKRLDLPQSGTIALYTGNFTTMGEDKGISDIIKALPEAPEILFVAVGGSEKDRSRYVAEASSAGMLGRVVLRGHTMQKMLALYQKAADMLLMPFPDTPHYRNHMSPVKMFEYMAAERPIIASDLPTIREILNESNALIVPPGNPPALARAMNSLRENPAQGEKCATQAQKEVAGFSWKARAEKILKFLPIK